MLRRADVLLADVSTARGMPVGHAVSYVRAALVEAEAVVYVYPTTSDDPDRIEVRRDKSGAWVNLITLLHREGLLVESGHRERFAIFLVGPEGPLGPAIAFDLSKPEARYRVNRGRRSGSRTP